MEKPESDALNFGSNDPTRPKTQNLHKRVWRGWTWSELSVMWANPEMTAEELSARIPLHSAKAIQRARDRYGRYRPSASVPLCQRCHEHPVNTLDRDARRWGLCRECAQAEKDWRDRNDARLRRENDARRQRRHKRRHGGGRDE